MAKYIEDTNQFGRTDRFEIVNEFPAGYQVWPIGRENFPHEGYLPLAVVDSNYHVDLNTLRCIEVESEGLALAALREVHHAKRADRDWFEAFRAKYLEEHPVKNYYVSMEEGDGIVIYTYDLTEDEVKRFVDIAAAPNRVTDIYSVEQDQLQYYCIDGRVWMDTPEKVAQVRARIA